MKRLLTTAAIAASVFSVGVSQAQDLKIAHVTGFTGPLEAYAKQLDIGMQLGFEYATKGKNEVIGRKIVIINKDDQLKPDRGRALLAEAYGDDNVDLAAGGISSGVALAMAPVAAEYEKILIAEGAADGITGEGWNRYIFRVGRNSSQDAVSNAAAIAAPGVCISTLAQDYAFGRDGVSAFKKAAESKGAKVVHEEYVALDATDFTAAAQRLFDSLKDKSDCKAKFIFGIYAGKGNPFGRIQDLQPERYGIKMSTGGNILPALVGYKQFPGMEGAAYYYYESPNNPVNDWFVKEHFKRHNSPPDFFTAQGMGQAMAIVAAVEKAKSTDTEKLIQAMEGLTFDSPKGKQTFRPQDHQSMQSMYHFKVVVKDGVEWAVPELVREIPASEMDIPIMNKR